MYEHTKYKLNTKPDAKPADAKPGADGATPKTKKPEKPTKAANTGESTNKAQAKPAAKPEAKPANAAKEEPPGK